ncbi:MAG: anti-sigma factor [Verrucomicrobia bacterium]|nr:anti-sigma factor [Verrucomicrobiota bacterium]
MIDLATQDEAADYLLGQMSPEARAAFEARIRKDPALQAHLREAGDAMVEWTLALPPEEPSAALRGRLLAQVAAEARAEQAAATVPFTPAPVLAPRRAPWGWMAAAAALVLGGAIAWQAERERAAAEERMSELRSQLKSTEARLAGLSAEAARSTAAADELRRRLEGLEKSNAELTAQIDAARGENVLGRVIAGALRATVAGGVDGPAPARGAFVWDPVKQEGVLTVENLPLIPPSFDYEIWVADAGQPIPVGTFRPTRVGRQTLRFKADTRISKATEFMVTREQRGGSKQIEGPAVLVSDKY